MNIGYTSHNTESLDETELICPICKSDIYVSKYGNNYYCTSDTCVSNSGYRNAVAFRDDSAKLHEVNLVSKFIERLLGGTK